jgi:hypothetical protein
MHNYYYCAQRGSNTSSSQSVAVQIPPQCNSAVAVQVRSRGVRMQFLLPVAQDVPPLMVPNYTAAQRKVVEAKYMKLQVSRHKLELASAALENVKRLDGPATFICVYVCVIE